MARRRVLLITGMLIVWGSLAYRFIIDSDRTDRLLAILMGVGVTALAVLILRGPVLPEDRAEDGDWGSGSGEHGSSDSGDGGDGGH